MNKPTEVDSMNRLRVQAERKAKLYRRALELACSGDADQVAFFVSEADVAMGDPNVTPPVGVQGMPLPCQAALDSPSIDMPQGFTPEERRAFILGVAAAGKAGSGVLGTTLETPNTTDRIMRALNQPGLSESKLATTIPMGELIAFVEALPPTAGVTPTLTPSEPKLGGCEHCGEGVTDFCRGKLSLCPKGLRVLHRNAGVQGVGRG